MKEVSVEVAPIILSSYDFLDFSYKVNSKQKDENQGHDHLDKVGVNISVEVSTNRDSKLYSVKLDTFVTTGKSDDDTVDEFLAHTCIRGIFTVLDDSLSSTKIKNYLSKSGASELYQIVRDRVVRCSQDTPFGYLMLPSMLFK